MQGLTFLEKSPKLPWTVFVGAAGMPGQTAFYGWKEFSHAKKARHYFRSVTDPGPMKDETVFITTSADYLQVLSARMNLPALTSLHRNNPFSAQEMVIQLAKRDRLKVIASAGSDGKVELMKQLGADVAFNYRTTNTREVLEREGPIDVYWDNVGGEILEAALDNANVYARFIECGMISGYNTGPQGIENINQMIQKTITMSGLLVFRLHQKYGKEFCDVMPAALASGELKYSEDLLLNPGKRSGEIIRGNMAGNEK
ncbi:hypothetical protein C8R45DRAFT_923154 [Mycena sanguinolenta]|nr:hypothetical protein C8R45DRAFT_923154 [Mycena sanguinolenta]